MSCSESPAANSFLVDSLISSGRGEAGGGGGGAGAAAVASCGLFPTLGGKRNEAASPGSGGGGGGLGPGAHGYGPSPIDLWLDRRRRRAATRGWPVPRAAPGARFRSPARASLRLGRCGPEGASPRFAARRGLAGRRGGARVVLGRGGALPGPFREQQSLAGEGLPGQFQR
uniref:Homeobox A10 n=1 Tax=Pan paniscus TaxID=9597 RepID=A0A2R8ZYC5_PANPA